MPLSRRQLLILASAPPLLAAAGAAGVAAHWYKQPPAAGYRFLSVAEATTLTAIAGAAWPGTTTCALDGADAGLDRFLDASMAALGDFQREGIRMLLHLFENMPLATDRARFSTLSRTRQGELLLSWLDSEIPEVRSAAQSVVVLSGMGYTCHPDAADVFGTIYRCRYGR